MTSETPCLSGCRHYNLTPYKEPDHLPNCPNARKPAEPPVCVICGAVATCRGAYDAFKEEYGCDDCCGHGNEDGHCTPLMPAEPPACRFHPTGPCDPAEPQSEPPIDFEQAAWEATHPTHDYLDLARAYLALLGENAALKVRVDDLENLVLDIDDGQEAATVYARAIRARRQEASNGK